MGVHQSIGMKGIVLFGNDEQKERFLPDLATGRKLAEFDVSRLDAWRAGVGSRRCGLRPDGSSFSATSRPGSASNAADPGNSEAVWPSGPSPRTTPGSAIGSQLVIEMNRVTGPRVELITLASTSEAVIEKYRNLVERVPALRMVETSRGWWVNGTVPPQVGETSHDPTPATPKAAGKRNDAQELTAILNVSLVDLTTSKLLHRTTRRAEGTGLSLGDAEGLCEAFDKDLGCGHVGA